MPTDTVEFPANMILTKSQLAKLSRADRVRFAAENGTVTNDPDPAPATPAPTSAPAAPVPPAKP